jgi:hypothetical protein
MRAAAAASLAADCCVTPFDDGAFVVEGVAALGVRGVSLAGS